jgi:hypothetical protein
VLFFDDAEIVLTDNGQDGFIDLLVVHGDGIPDIDGDNADSPSIFTMPTLKISLPKARPQNRSLWRLRSDQKRFGGVEVYEVRTSHFPG